MTSKNYGKALGEIMANALKGSKVKTLESELRAALWELDKLDRSSTVMLKSRNHWKSLCDDIAICLADNLKQLEAEKTKVAELEEKLALANLWTKTLISPTYTP